MGRDLRQVGRLNCYPDRCYYYASESVDKNKLKPEAQPLGRFYKKDVVPFKWHRVVIDGVVTSRRQFSGVIETLDHVEELRPDMFVKDQTGMLFKVGTDVISDDENRSKNVGTRPCVKTTITLIGVGAK